MERGTDKVKLLKSFADVERKLYSPRWDEGEQLGGQKVHSRVGSGNNQFESHDSRSSGRSCVDSATAIWADLPSARMGRTFAYRNLGYAKWGSDRSFGGS